MKVSVQFAQVSVFFEGPLIEDLETLKNAALGFTQTMLDAAGYQRGHHYLVEITTLRDSEERELVYGVGLGVMEATAEERLSMGSLVMDLAVTNPALGHALGDLREAMRQPRHTGFHCQRVSEAIRQHFQTDRGDKEAWAAMREALNISETRLKSLSEFGTPQRHAEIVPMTGGERVRDLTLAWALIDRFVLYLSSGEEALARDKFPLLE